MLRKLVKDYSWLLLLLAVGVSGCSTIVGQPTQVIPIFSKPSGARISIVNEQGALVYRGTTPARVRLEKSDGTQFGDENYIVVLTKKGYKPQAIRLRSDPRANTYLWGNLVLTGAAATASAASGFAVGLAAWVFVDPSNGRMYTIDPSSITAELEPKNGSNRHENLMAAGAELAASGAAGAIELVLGADGSRLVRVSD